MTAGASSNSEEIAAALERRAALTLPQAVSVVRHYAMLLEAQIKANASGRPGPNAPTGDYRRSWQSQVNVSGEVVTAVVGTDAPQAMRLEFGFVGRDSLGRLYDQPPYPHVGPAVETIRPLFLAALGGEVVEGSGT